MVDNRLKLLPLGELCSFSQGEQVPSSSTKATCSDGWIRYLYIRDFFSDKFQVFVENKYPNKIVHPHEIIMVNTGATAGDVYRGKHGVLCNNAFRISINDECSGDLDYDFLWQFLNSELKRRSLNGLFNHTGQPHVGHKNIARLRIPLPALPEQQKITAILSTWDRAIELTEKLIAAKQKRKQALMQQLLTGKVRFAEFGEPAQGNNPPTGWTSHRLSELGSTYTGLQGVTKDDFGAGRPYIHYTNIFENSRVTLDDLPLVNVQGKGKQTEVRCGDMFFTVSSETPNEVGMAAVLLEEAEETYLNSFCFGFRLTDFQTLLPEFARFHLRGAGFRRSVVPLAQGATRYNLSKTQLVKLKVLLPAVSEQRKIAEVLDRQEAEITMIRFRCEQLHQQKRGLMQQLLTGKVRVNVDAEMVKG